jgi:hypothetical protein
MPYFIYRVTQDRHTATLLQEFETFKPASTFAKQERANTEAPEGTFVKLMHADDSLDAERLVKEFHQASSPVEEWE